MRCRDQALNERSWVVDTAALRLVTELLRHDPACRIAVRGRNSLTTDSLALAASKRSGRLSLTGGDGSSDVDGALSAAVSSMSGRSGSSAAVGGMLVRCARYPRQVSACRACSVCCAISNQAELPESEAQRRALHVPSASS